MAAKGKIEYWLTEDGLALLRGWTRDGLTLKEIAKDKIHITERTLYRWAEKYNVIMSALKKTAEIVDSEVEQSLHDQAVGYWKEVEEPVKIKKKRRKPDGEIIEYEEIQYVKKRVYYPPVTAATIFWMKCRKKWNDRTIDPEETKESVVIIDDVGTETE